MKKKVSVNEEIQATYEAGKQATPDTWPEPKPRLAEWKDCLKGQRGPVISAPESAKDYFRSLMGGMDKEAFVVIYLDHRNHVRHADYQLGTVDHTAVYPREVLKTALEQNATGIIIGHNHPAGSLEASEGDKQLTRQIVTAARALGITVHDHLIVTNEGHYSFRVSGLL